MMRVNAWCQAWLLFVNFNKLDSTLSLQEGNGSTWYTDWRCTDTAEKWIKFKKLKISPSEIYNLIRVQKILRWNLVGVFTSRTKNPSGHWHQCHWFLQAQQPVMQTAIGIFCHHVLCSVRHSIRITVIKVYSGLTRWSWSSCTHCFSNLNGEHTKMMACYELFICNKWRKSS